ncbi:MAG: hypothetical protein EOO40_02045 [Deltaproteobacteria bacterium]|nr:MAG: hypothetical protein EOO40_02045 [Deltaproteobacteria bacterium]
MVRPPQGACLEFAESEILFEERPCSPPQLAPGVDAYQVAGAKPHPGRAWSAPRPAAQAEMRLCLLAQPAGAALDLALGGDPHLVGGRAKLMARSARLSCLRTFVSASIGLQRPEAVGTMLQRLQTKATPSGLAECTGLCLCTFLEAASHSLRAEGCAGTHRQAVLRDVLLRLQIGLMRQPLCEPFYLALDSCMQGLRRGLEQGSGIAMRRSLEHALAQACATLDVGDPCMAFVDHIDTMVYTMV